MSITSFQFARLLRSKLRGAVISTVDRTLLPYYRVAGRFDVGPVVVPLEIRVWKDFEVVRRHPPAVRCDASWMRDDIDWHNSREYGMCWILQAVWCDGMGWEGKKALTILQEGCEWLVKDVRCLISRHYTGYLEGFADWPDEWPFWSHYNDGAKEYEREKRRLRRNRYRLKTA